MTHAEKVAGFRALHQRGAPFVIPNPWDAGSARILEGLGFKALATTSSGFALTQGRHDYSVTRNDVLNHCYDIAAAVDVPVTADLENGFGPKPKNAAKTVRRAAETGICGGSIEDASGDSDNPIYDLSLAVERIAAAAEAAQKSEDGFVLTARAEAYLHGQGDLNAIIARLQAYDEAGADILYAPGLPDMDAVRAICSSVSKPVNILIYGGLAQHDVAEFAEAGAARLSVGGALAWSAYGTLADAAVMIGDGKFDGLSANRKGAKQVGRWLK